MCVDVQMRVVRLRMLGPVRAIVRVHRKQSKSSLPALRVTLIKEETTMKITLIAALLAVATLSACEKTTVNPAPTVVTPTVEVPVAAPAPVAVPVPVPGPAGAPGEPGKDGAPGEPGKSGDTVIVMPEAEKTN